MFILLDYGRFRLPASLITHLEACANYTIIHLVGGKKHLTSQTLKNFEELTTGAGFIRTHKSYLVNPHYLLHFCPKERFIILQGDLRLLVSRRNKNVLMPYAS